MTVFNICEYTFQIKHYNIGMNFVRVFDTSLNEYVGEFYSTKDWTKELCEKWLDEFYGF